MEKGAGEQAYCLKGQVGDASASEDALSAMCILPLRPVPRSAGVPAAIHSNHCHPAPKRPFNRHVESRFRPSA